MHCGGGNFQEAAKREMTEKCVTASRFTFSA